MEYTVHFQKGTVVGARRLRMVPVEAETAKEAVKVAKREVTEPGFKMVRVDHYEDDDKAQYGFRRVIDM